MESRLEALIARLENVADRLEGRAGATGASASATSASAPASAPTSGASDPVWLTEYKENILNGPVKSFVEKSHAFGGEKIQELTKNAEQGFKVLGEILAKAAKVKKPDAAKLQKFVLEPIVAVCKKASAFRDNRGEWFAHESALAEGLQALGWVAIEPAPVPYITNYIESADFHGMKVLKLKVPEQTAWYNAFKTALTTLMGYVKQYHTTGTSWNKSGIDIAEYTAAPSAASAAPRAGPPPPPPMAAMPPAPPAPSSSAAAPAAGGLSAIFGQINSGNVTSGLKHVTKDMKTKSQSDRPAVVPASTPTPPAAAAAAKVIPPAGKPLGPPLMEVQRGNWVVENYTDNNEIVLDDVNIKQSVYISRCSKVTIQIKGKIKAIVIDGCKRANLVFQDILSVCEVVNCENVKLQVLGSVPSIAVDKTSGFQVYLSRESLGCKFVSSKSSEMNVSYPDEDGEYIEMPIPEQFVTEIHGKKLKTTVSDLYSM
eukprot:GILJ01005446.1.p1 GENE.GILJ01005446.1~~GILJ01005446.1.p1  ORF type:complete len:498 (+),score=105.47 GILJ01005446.1:42-1496(+)